VEIHTMDIPSFLQITSDANFKTVVMRCQKLCGIFRASIWRLRNDKNYYVGRGRGKNHTQPQGN